jgi:hypothetical protein
MADIFRKTNADRERNAGLGPPVPTPPQAPPGPDPATGISFTKQGPPVDPAAAAAKQAKLVELLRNQ